MSSALVERILEEVKRLTPDERHDLIEALAQEPSTPVPAFDTYERERSWIEQNREGYLNQWVALDGDRLLAHGTDAREVYLAARSAGVTVPYVERIKPKDELPFGGW